MIKRVFINRTTALVLIFLTSVCSGGEFRKWTLVDGAGFEAKCIVVIGKTVNFKFPSGKIKKLPLDQLIIADRTYIELENPPVFRIEFVRDRDQKVFDLMPGQASYSLRPPEYRCHYGVKIKQRDTYAYKHELRMEFFAIGKERAGQRLILLDYQNTEPFFLTRENRWSYKFRSNREVVLQNYTYDEVQKRGRKYHGYLILLRDVRGKVIAMETSHDWLYENLKNLTERGVGNYMDKSCVRTFPTRPYNKRLGK